MRIISSVQFQVKEYVLAKFAVGLTVPPYILKTDNEITVDITARYSYGKPVIGSVVAQLNNKFSPASHWFELIRWRDSIRLQNKTISPLSPSKKYLDG